MKKLMLSEVRELAWNLKLVMQEYSQVLLAPSLVFLFDKQRLYKWLLQR